jgi:L-alanine-DL-glutamate epimerase-like enolase superfamily enzyme
VKITDIRAIVPVEAQAPQDWRGWFAQILVMVETENGLRGYGMGGGGEAGAHVVNTALRHELVGADATEVEKLWQRMYQSTLAYGRKGLALMAISGVDLALWDLRGRRQGKSIIDLLGGASGSPLPAYKTTGLDGIPLDPGEGFAAYKVGGLSRLNAREDVDQIVEELSEARDKVGSGLQLMADAGMGWRDPEVILTLCERLVHLNLGWLEEPLPADDLEGYAWLRERSPIPIAGGEHEFTAAAFTELMRRGCHDIYQPDVCWCGGLTQVVEIYHLAREHGVRVCPHRGSEPWGLPAIAALDSQPLAESGRPWMEWVGGKPTIIDGLAHTTTVPGFDIATEDLASRFESG